MIAGGIRPLGPVQRRRPPVRAWRDVEFREKIKSHARQEASSFRAVKTAPWRCSSQLGDRRGLGSSSIPGMDAGIVSSH